MKKPFSVRVLALAAFLPIGAALQAQVPQLINYQGRVAVDTTNFDGPGQFKFALVNATGTTTFWSNDGSSIAGSKPAAAIALTVSKGLYSVLLGDATLPHMTIMPATVFSNTDVRLRVWFDDGAHGPQLLSPDQRIAAVGYAMIADNVSDGAITSAKIASGAVGGAQIANGSISSNHIATGAVGSAQLASNAVQSSNIAPGAAGSVQLNAVNGVLVHIGDSNTNGRIGWRISYKDEWLGRDGVFYGWTSYNLGQNGSTLANWATSETAKADDPAYSSLPPADYTAYPDPPATLGDPGDGALARAINAHPDVIVLCLGTNDVNSPSGRATIGTEASLRNNLALLTNFLLSRTHATIILRMPQPLAFRTVVTRNGSTTNGDSHVILSSTAGLQATENISGPGIPWGTNIASVDSATQVTLTAPATATSGSVDFSIANDPFYWLTQWSDASEPAEASRRLRTVYREWIGRNSRVLVYDSQSGLFGTRCDDKSVNAQDPWLGPGNPLISDSLHPDELGYRRETQQIATMINPALPKVPRIDLVHPDVPRYATWATTLFVRGSAATSGTRSQFDVDLTPEAVVLRQEASSVASADGTANDSRGYVGGNYAARKPFLEFLSQLGAYAGYNQLLNVPDKTDLYAYSHSNRSIVRLSNVALSNLVALDAYPYANLTIEAPDLTGFGGGAVTFFTKRANNVPFRPPTVLTTSLTSNAAKYIGSPSGAGFMIHGVSATRRISLSNPAPPPVITLWLSNLGDGGFSDGTGTYPAPGKKLGTIAHQPYGTRADLVFDPVNFPNGDVWLPPDTTIAIRITSGDINTHYSGNVEIYVRDN